MISHITLDCCSRFLSGESPLHNFQDCNKWSELSNKLRTAGDDILSFMHNPTLFTKTDALSDDEMYDLSFKLRKTLENESSTIEERVVQSFMKLQDEMTDQLKQHLTVLLKTDEPLKDFMKKTAQVIREEEAESKIANRQLGEKNEDS